MCIPPGYPGRNPYGSFRSAFRSLPRVLGASKLLTDPFGVKGTLGRCRSAGKCRYPGTGYRVCLLYTSPSPRDRG
eukprot:1271532-Rhodomonas_salina.1